MAGSLREETRVTPVIAGGQDQLVAGRLGNQARAFEERASFDPEGSRVQIVRAQEDHAIRRLEGPASSCGIRVKEGQVGRQDGRHSTLAQIGIRRGLAGDANRGSCDGGEALR
jgi:hypothetical protein